jgi:hypothetical protein
MPRGSGTVRTRKWPKLELLSDELMTVYVQTPTPLIVPRENAVMPGSTEGLVG